MAAIIQNIENAKNNGHINMYALLISSRNKKSNRAIALPDNHNDMLRNTYCESLVPFSRSIEVKYNPIVKGFENNTYEYVPINTVQAICDEILNQIHNFIDFAGDNRYLIPGSNCYVCELIYESNRYYLCSLKLNIPHKYFGCSYLMQFGVDDLVLEKPKDMKDVFVMKTTVDFILDTVENKVLIFNKNAFENFFHYDEYQKELVQRESNKLDNWSFVENLDFVKSKLTQKNVYLNLAKIFVDDDYLNEINNVSPSRLKATLLTRCNSTFTEDDFEGDKLRITSSNLEYVMKMLSKGFRYNFFADRAENE